jgi:hypothetical protein
MSTELVKDNMHIFRAFSERMHNDNLEEFVKTRQAGPLSKGPVTILRYEKRKEEERKNHATNRHE